MAFCLGAVEDFWMQDQRKREMERTMLRLLSLSLLLRLKFVGSWRALNIGSVPGAGCSTSSDDSLSRRLRKGWREIVGWSAHELCRTTEDNSAVYTN